MNTNNVPEIRFKGFSGEWEESNINDAALFIDGNYGEKYPKANEFIERGVPFFTSAVIGTSGVFNKKNIKYISEEKNSTLVKAQSLGGDLILTNRGASMGSVAQIPKEYGVVNIGPQLTRIRGTEKADNLFLLSILKHPIYNQRLLSINAGSAMNFVGLGVLGKFEFLTPTIEEQTAIGNTFQQLDSLINQHQQKHNKLCNIKQAMLQKMFPQQGHTVPQIRFKGFEGEWGHFTIGCCSSLITKGTTPMTIGRCFVDKGVAFVKVESVDEMGNFNPFKFAYIDAETDQILARSRIKENDLLVSIAGALGRAAIVKKQILPANTNQALAIIRLKTDSPVEVDFLYHFTKTRDFKNFVEASGSQGAQPNLSLGDISGVKIFAPTSDEQAHIAQFFNKLDSLINQHQQQITKLNNIKQACLSKMFV